MPPTDTETPSYPSLYQINTRVWMTELSQALGRRATLDDIPDAAIEEIAAMGFDWVWLLSVWQTGLIGQQVSRTNPIWRREFEQTLPDLRDEDIAGSGFAVTGYSVHAALGTEAALARLRARLRACGLKLMLDFVPNHTALDHPWVRAQPELYVQGTESELGRAPENYIRIDGVDGNPVFAHGRDPFFPGWPDTLQLDYSNPATVRAMQGELMTVAGQCDGARCDMAMLILPDVFERTWGRRAQPFWSDAVRAVRARFPGFFLMAEVYWDLEWTMQQLGFSYAYDKRLYDRLRDGHPRPIRDHLRAGLDFQARLARFLENHDEPRAAATFPSGMHEAAAVITYLSPGLRFFQEGQFEGRTRRVSPHLVRRPAESANAQVSALYRRLLAVLRDPVVREGSWRLLECVPAWDGNWTWDSFLAWRWDGIEGERLLAVVNYAAHQSQCYVRGTLDEIGGGGVSEGTARFADRLATATYDRDVADLTTRGLYIDMPPWGCQVFNVSAVDAERVHREFEPSPTERASHVARSKTLAAG